MNGMIYVLPTIVYYSSTTENTHRFVKKLQWDDTVRIPIHVTDDTIPIVSRPYCLICPTYGGGATMMRTHADTRPVPPQVRKFLHNPINADNLTAVIATGNINFGKEYCLSGEVIARAYGVPYVYRLELLGTEEDVVAVRNGLMNFSWVNRDGVFHQ